MYIKIRNKHLKLVEYKTFKERFKSLKFNFKVLDYAIKFPNKRVINTVFFVQRIDICITDKNDTIVYLEENVNSERYFIHKHKGRNIYLLPLGSVKYLSLGKKINSYK